MEYYDFRAMNSSIVFAAEGGRTAHREERRGGFEQARSFVEAAEKRFTRFFETSELSALNRASGEWLSVSASLYDVVRQASEYVDETGGLFDPSILDALEHAGYDRSMDEIRAMGVRPAPKPAPVLEANIRGIELDRDRSAIRLPRGLRLDLGGIAKGWIVERAAKVLTGFCDACAVSAGGDMYMIGLPEGETAWEVGLEDPRAPDENISVLTVGPGAVATSSVLKRRWQLGGLVMHHLIDPRTRRPAESDWLSVTVIARHTTTAEVYAKALLMAGSACAYELAARRGDIRFIAVDACGRLWDSNQAKEGEEDEIRSI